MLDLTHSIDSYRSLSSFFSTSNFEEVIKKGEINSNNLTRLSKYAVNLKGNTYSDIYANIYSCLIKNYRNEYFYKNALLNEVLKKHGLRTTTVFKEFKIGSSWADFVLVNGFAKVFEIKTGLDNLSKLDKQLSNYCKFANEVYVVTSSKHALILTDKFRDTQIGVIEYTEKGKLNTLKKALQNSNILDHNTIFKTLRMSEYLAIVKDEFQSVPSIPNTLIFRECLRLTQTLEINKFQRLALEQLKKRSINCPELLVDNRTPSEMKFLCYAADLKEKDYLQFYSLLSQKI